LVGEQQIVADRAGQQGGVLRRQREAGAGCVRRQVREIGAPKRDVAGQDGAQRHQRFQQSRLAAAGWAGDADDHAGGQRGAQAGEPDREAGRRRGRAIIGIIRGQAEQLVEAAFGGMPAAAVLQAAHDGGQALDTGAGAQRGHGGECHAGRPGQHERQQCRDPGTGGEQQVEPGAEGGEATLGGEQRP